MSTSNILDTYIKEISAYPLLTPAQERAYAIKAAEGDTQAQDKLVVSNLRLVVFMAKRYLFDSYWDIKDLIQEGNIGLMKAAKKFNPTYKLRFSTYAALWIRNSLRREVYYRSRLVKIPVHLAEEAKLDVITQVIPVADIEETLKTEFWCSDAFLEKHTKKALQRLLTKQERQYIEMRFWKNMTLEEIGKVYGCSRENSRLTEGKIVRKLRHAPRFKALSKDSANTK